jgi:hypothetical protein
MTTYFNELPLNRALGQPEIEPNAFLQIWFSSASSTGVEEICFYRS